MHRPFIIVLSGLLVVTLAGWQGAAEAVPPEATVTTIGISPDPPAVGDTITVTAHVTKLVDPQLGLAPVGEVVFDVALDESGLFGNDVVFESETLVQGTASIQIDLTEADLPFLASQSDRIYVAARYEPDNSQDFTWSVSDPPLPVDLTWPAPLPVPTTTTVTGPESAVVGEAAELSAQVSPAEADGVVQFSVDEVSVGEPVAVDGGSASLLYTYAFAGLSTVRASFTPTDPEAYEGSEDLSGLDVTVTSPEPWPGPIATTTVLTAPTSATVGTPATLVAAVSPGAAAGTVQFSVDGSPVGSPVPVAAGAASVSHTFASAGVSTVQATFTPADPVAYAGSTGMAGVAVRVPTVTTVTGPDFVLVDMPAVLTVEVSPASAAGTVAFSVNGAPVGAPVTVDGGVASLAHAFTNMGVSTVRAAFTPTDPAAYDASSDSAGRDVTVDPGTTAIEVTGPDGATVGEEATLTATVLPADAVGTVTFLADGSEVATVDLDAGVATAPYTFAAAGESSVVATFEPAEGSSYGAATSTARPVTVDPGTTAESEEEPVNPGAFRVSFGTGCKVAPGRAGAEKRDGVNDWFWFGPPLPGATPFMPLMLRFSPISLVPGFITPIFSWFTSFHFEACILGLAVCIGCHARQTMTTVSGTVQCLPTETGYACPFDFPKFDGMTISADVPLPAAFGGQQVNVESKLTSTDPVTGSTTTLLSHNDQFQVPKRTVLTAKLAPVKSNLTSVKRGKSVAYRVEVRNAGVVTAKGVRTCVSLGKGAEVLVAKHADVRGRRACWTISSLKGDRTVTRTLTLAAPRKSGPLKIVADVTPRRTQADPVRIAALLDVR